MMKNILLLLVGLYLLFPSVASAHMAGQPPFFRINGVYTLLYPVPTSSVPDFFLPQDIADKNFLVNDTLEIDMDIAQLPILPQVIDQTTFLWDFGDGEKAEGLRQTHQYKKPGSYFLTVEAKYRSDEPQLIQSTLVHILPNQSYQLPQGKIVVDGKTSEDPLVDPIGVDFGKGIHFDASTSIVQGTGVEYYWDLGNGKFSKEKILEYKYDDESMQVFPVLRVKDANGFIADAYVELGDSDVYNFDESSSSGSLINWIIVGVVISLAGIGLALFYILRVKK